MKSKNKKSKEKKNTKKLSRISFKGVVKLHLPRFLKPASVKLFAYFNQPTV